MKNRLVSLLMATLVATFFSSCVASYNARTGNISVGLGPAGPGPGYHGGGDRQRPPQGRPPQGHYGGGGGRGDFVRWAATGERITRHEAERRVMEIRQSGGGRRVVQSSTRRRPGQDNCSPSRAANLSRSRRPSSSYGTQPQGRFVDDRGYSSGNRGSIYHQVPGNTGNGGWHGPTQVFINLLVLEEEIPLDGEGNPFFYEMEE